MRKKSWHEEEIAEILENMPIIKDSKDKSILYQQISSQLMDGNKRSTKNKKSRLLPILGSIMAILLVAFIPLVLKDNSFQSSEENSIYDTQSTGMDESEVVEEHTESNSAPQGNIFLQAETKPFVLNSLEDDEKVVYGAIPDEQFQYVIPIAFIVSKSDDLDEHYNRLEDYLRERNLSTDNYLLEGVTYQFQNTNQEVQIDLPNNFSIDSSARAYMFEKLMEAMFIPVGVEKATFLSDNKDGVELGPYGVMKEMSLDEDKASYKLYNGDFLVPIPHERESSVQDAILDMKESQEEFDIVQTIPEMIDFDIESVEDELVLTYNGEFDAVNNQEMLTMIEALLMTAKSYGYDSVRFQNMPLEQVGNYHFSEPLKVPEAINPYEIDG